MAGAVANYQKENVEPGARDPGRTQELHLSQFSHFDWPVAIYWPLQKLRED